MDTRHFPDTFKWQILSEIDDLDANTDGVLFNSENFQALNLMQEKYREQVKCIYIDPPYNTGNDGFLYKDGFPHSSWLSMMRDRVVLSQEFLNNNGVLGVSLDENEIWRLQILAQPVMDHVGTLIVQTATDNNPQQVTVEHEYLTIFAKHASLQGHWRAVSKKAEQIVLKYKELKGLYGDATVKIQADLRNWIKSHEDDLQGVTHYDNVDDHGVFHDGDVANTKFGGYTYEVIHPTTNRVCKIPDKGFRFKEDTMKEMIARDDIMFGRDETTLIKPKTRIENANDVLRSYIYEDGRAATKEIEHMFHRDVFKNPKSPVVLGRVFGFVMSKDDTILDFFAGSGTTGHAIVKMNREDDGQRRYILVEMGDYFDTVLFPRIKKVVYCPDWKDGKPAGGESISQIVKYHTLEQYEDTLNNIEVKQQAQAAQQAVDLFGDDYLLRYMLELETRGSASLLNLSALTEPFSYTLNIKQGDEIKPHTVDLMETFNYLLGLSVKKMRAYENDGRAYRAVSGTKDDQRIVVVWRDAKNIADSVDALTSDKAFITQTIVPDLLGENISPDRLFVNSPCAVTGVEAVEPEFKRLMFGEAI